MKLATLTTQQKRLLDSYSEADGVVKFFIYDCKENSFDSENHREAVILAFRELQRQCNDDEEHFSKEENIPISDDLKVTIDEDAANCLIPAQISWKEFLGTRYDYERNGLIVRGNGDLWNEYFYYTDQVKRVNIIPANGIDDGIGAGFAFAFSSPPWGATNLSAEEIGILFDQFLKFIICDSTYSIIYEWPTNWSNYFDTEVEWWGSFLWSLSNSDSNQIVVIAASTTG